MEWTTGDVITIVTASVVFMVAIFGMGMKWANSKSRIDRKIRKLRTEIIERLDTVDKKLKLLSLDRHQGNAKIISELEAILDGTRSQKRRAADESDDDG